MRLNRHARRPPAVSATRPPFEASLDDPRWAGGLPERPMGILVVANTASGEIVFNSPLAHESQSLLDAVATALDQLGGPIAFSETDVASYLRAHFSQRIVRSPTPTADAARDEFLYTGRPDGGAISPRVYTPELWRVLQLFNNVKPWETLPSNLFFELFSESETFEWSYLNVMGQSREQRGLGFFRNLDHVRAILRNDHDAVQLPHVMVGVDPIGEIPKGIRQFWYQHGFPRNSTFLPVLFRLGTTEPNFALPEAELQSLLSNVVVALTAACVVNPSPEFTLHIPGHDTVEVQLWSEGGWIGRGF